MPIEICVDSLAAAIAAEKCGADRIELCSHLPAGGLTPSHGFLLKCKEYIRIPVHVMIRPRSGNFLYTAEEFMVMKSDVEMVAKLGFEGIVFGILKSNGQPDIDRTREMIQAAGTMKAIFHRAFDECASPITAMEDLIGCGIQILLTSGAKNTAAEGTELISELVRLAGKRITVMPGSGITAHNIKEIAVKTRASWFHLSAKKYITDVPVNRNLQSQDLVNDRLRTVDEEMIRKIKSMSF